MQNSEPLVEKLERQRELPNVVGVCLSAMLGVGAFVLPGFVDTSWPTLWLGYVVAGFFALPFAISIAELATAMPASSGIFVYLDRAFGPMGGTFGGLSLWCAKVLAASLVASAAAAYLSPTLAEVGVSIPARLLAVLTIALLVLLNLRAFRRAAKIQLWIFGIAFIGLGGFIASGMTRAGPEVFELSLGSSTSGFAAAVGLLFLGYSGLTKVASIANEVRRPSRNLPLALLISLFVAVVVYVLVALSLLSALPGQMGDDVTPIRSMAIAIFDSPLLSGAAVACAALALITFANGSLINAARLQFLMGRAGLLPEAVGHLDPGKRTPRVATLVSGAVAAVAAGSLELIDLALLSASLLAVVAMSVCVSVVVLRESRAQWYQPGFRSPLYPWTQILGVGLALILLIGLGAISAIAISLVAAIAFAVYLMYGRRRAPRRGVIAQRSRRADLVRSGQFDIAKPATASVVVALFGSEHSPETLAELAKALAEGGRVEVVYLTELPEQTTVEALTTEDPRRVSVERRIRALASERKIDLEFNAVTSRDVAQTINSLTQERQCKWLVTEWTLRGEGRVTFTNPLGWLHDHLGSNLATFCDGGVRTIREIMVHVEPGPHDALVLGTADHLAEVHGANLAFVRFVNDSADPEEVQAAGDYLDQVRELCSAKSETRILRGGREDQALIVASGSTDLIITAGVAVPSLWLRLRGSVWDRVAEAAACSILRLRTPPDQLHASFERYRGKTDEGARSLVDYIDERCVRAGIEPGKKEALFQTFAAAFSQLSDRLKSPAIVAGLWERERSQNTALGRGIALPHATLAESERTHLGVFTAASPIDFNAPDSVGVDVFFVTIGPPRDRQEHLRLLGAIAKLCSKTDVLVRLRAAWSGAEMLDAIRECATEVGI